MSRKGYRRNSQNYNYGGRETYEFSKQSLPLSKIYNRQNIPLSEFEDRRRFHPEGKDRPATNFRGITARLNVAGIPILKAHRPEGKVYNFHTEGYQPVPWKLGFVSPERVLVCVRRKIRQQVLHAIGIAGRRGIGHGGVKFTQESKYRC